MFVCSGCLLVAYLLCVGDFVWVYLLDYLLFVCYCLWVGFGVLDAYVIVVVFVGVC